MILLWIIGIFITIFILQASVGYFMKNRIETALKNYKNDKNLLLLDQNIFTNFIKINKFAFDKYAELKSTINDSQSYIQAKYEEYFPYRDQYLDQVKELFKKHKNLGNLPLDIMEYFSLTTYDDYPSYSLWNLIRGDVDFYIDLIRENGYKDLNNTNYDKLSDEKKMELMKFFNESGNVICEDYKMKIAIHDLIKLIDTSIFCNYFSSKHITGPLAILSLEKVAMFVAKVSDTPIKVANQYVINALDEANYQMRRSF